MVHADDCVKCKHRRFCIIRYNQGREQKKGDKGECSDFNFHRLCHSDHCSVMRRARENPLSVPKECNPFHHPIATHAVTLDAADEKAQALPKHDSMVMKAWEPSEAHAGDCNGSHTHSVCHVHILSTLPNRENHPLK